MVCVLFIIITVNELRITLQVVIYIIYSCIQLQWRDGTKNVINFNCRDRFLQSPSNVQTSPLGEFGRLSARKRLVFVVLNEFNMLCLHLFLRQVYGPSTCVYKTVRSILDYLLSALYHIFTSACDLRTVYIPTHLYIMCTRVDIDVIAGAVVLSSNSRLNNISV